MSLRTWQPALAWLLALVGPAAAQENRYALKFDESNRFAEVRNGTKKTLDATDREVIKKKAQVEINRFMRSASTSGGTGTAEVESLPAYISNFGNSTIIDVLGSPRKLTEAQREMVELLGQEMVAELQKLVGTKEKPSGADMVVKVNAARLLSVLARSGYPGVADLAADIITNPQQHDAVKLYAFEALNHLFSVAGEDAQSSVFARDRKLADSERQAIAALIDFIARKPAVTPSTPEDEVNALRYVRREAVRALGKVRKPILRDTDDKIIAVPAIWLLRVANSDRNLVPSPGLSERVEGLVGYLYLNADKTQNMDFAAGYVATAIRDLTLEYQNSQYLEKIKAEDSPPANLNPAERDYHPWKLTGNRLQVGLRLWLDNWSDPILGARPPEVRAMMTQMIDIVDKNILQYMIETGKKSEITLQALTDWLSTTKFPSRTLFPDDKDGFIVRPEAAP